MTDEEMLELIILDNTKYSKGTTFSRWGVLDRRYKDCLDKDLTIRHLTMHKLYHNHKLPKQEILEMSFEERLTYLYLFKKD